MNIIGAVKKKIGFTKKPFSEEIELLEQKGLDTVNTGNVTENAVENPPIHKALEEIALPTNQHIVQEQNGEWHPTPAKIKSAEEPQSTNEDPTMIEMATNFNKDDASAAINKSIQLKAMDSSPLIPEIFESVLNHLPGNVEVAFDDEHRENENVPYSNDLLDENELLELEEDMKMAIYPSDVMPQQSHLFSEDFVAEQDRTTSSEIDSLDKQEAELKNGETTVSIIYPPVGNEAAYQMTFVFPLSKPYFMEAWEDDLFAVGYFTMADVSGHTIIIKPHETNIIKII